MKHWTLIDTPTITGHPNTQIPGQMPEPAAVAPCCTTTNISERKLPAIDQLL
jgi:hypothetical protein